MGVLDTTYTFTATDIVTSAKLNNVIDQTTFTSSAVATGNTTLAVTASGQLKVNSLGIGANELANDSVTQAKIATNVVGKGATFLAFKTASQAITGNVYTQITSISNIAFNTDSGFSGATSTFTAPVAGYYLFMGILQSSGASASNNFQASIWINNTDNILGGQINNGTNPRTTVEGIRYLSAGSTVTLKAIASSAMTIDLAEFSGCLIRSA